MILIALHCITSIWCNTE